MSKKTDKQLGMDQTISRRDLIHDAGASAYTHVAIDEAHRAVKQLP